MIEAKIVTGTVGAPYIPGLLALREGSILERALRALEQMPDIVLVNATGRDHPRRAPQGNARLPGGMQPALASTVTGCSCSPFTGS